jgi:pimeloyl-ACP methyl ester carboxylesterase
MAGAITAVLGLDHRTRVASLTFLSTTCGGSDLPGMSQEFLNYTNVTPDLSNSTAVVEHIVEFARICSGGSPLFDEDATRLLVEQDVARTQDIAAALTNHFLIEFDGPRSGTLSDINVPTLVVHGELDPVFPLPHGEALRNTIPGATLLVLPQTGHELPRPVWAEFVEALIRHTR